jgi:hypothetical protein
MKDQHRSFKVIGALVVAMTIGAFVLISLDRQSLSDGPFSLARLYNLGSVQNDVKTVKNYTNWDGIEVYYDDGATCDLDKLVRNNKSQIDFAIGNAGSGQEGFIKRTAKWINQKPSSLDLQQGQNIIRICIINDAGKSQPSNLQVARTTELVELLSDMHNITSARIRYPVNWQI